MSDLTLPVQTLSSPHPSSQSTCPSVIAGAMSRRGLMKRLNGVMSRYRWALTFVPFEPIRLRTIVDSTKQASQTEDKKNPESLQEWDSGFSFWLNGLLRLLPFRPSFLHCQPDPPTSLCRHMPTGSASTAMTDAAHAFQSVNRPLQAITLAFEFAEDGFDVHGGGGYHGTRPRKLHISCL